MGYLRNSRASVIVVRLRRVTGLRLTPFNRKPEACASDRESARLRLAVKQKFALAQTTKLNQSLDSRKRHGARKYERR